MKIFFDARWTRTDHLDGISRYSCELLAAFARMQPVTMIICDERQLKLLPRGIPYVVLHSPFSVKELRVATVLNRLGADIVVSPMQVIGGGRRHYKLILTVHDLIYYRHRTPPQFLPLPVRIVWRTFHAAYWPQRWLLNRADFILTVSDTTKQQIEKHHLTTKPVAIVPNAPTKVSSQRTPPLPKKDLIYVGSFLPYKNVETLVRSMAKLPGYKLHLVSKITPTRQAQLVNIATHPRQLIFHHGLSDSAYHALLRTATALVTASKDEGFGLPIVEAMAQGVPVICSDIPIFHEVAVKAGLFFDPTSTDSFTAAVHQLESPKTRSKQITLAKKQAKSYSWQKSAATLSQLIKGL
ncbi:MAG TPA: glycosyltransferase family 1 protein [Candidatus Saccharimonadales bacterium]|jgi:glycosyltransferase involved in cell wall biosynthesis|nr:glycosyltransferase family 1 protein [Candidatus Saccharimonadales bacterium]